jgi:microcompartment protein CcmL/EutN
MENAIALLEVQAMVTAIVGLDAMVKAANVKLIHVEKRLGGRLVTVVVEGSVSAVTAALEAGVEAAKAVGNVACAEVIARPHADIMRFSKARVSENVRSFLPIHHRLEICGRIPSVMRKKLKHLKNTAPI